MIFAERGCPVLDQPRQGRKCCGWFRTERDTAALLANSDTNLPRALQPAAFSLSSPAMRILSGIQPSGALHLGNYFGMMLPAIELQAQGDAYYFIADYHSMTSLFDPAQRRQNTLDVALDFLACGLDPKKSVFFRQSDVPEVTELAWLLTTLTPMGLLERCHSYKFWLFADMRLETVPMDNERNNGHSAKPVKYANRR